MATGTGLERVTTITFSSLITILYLILGTNMRRGEVIDNGGNLSFVRWVNPIHLELGFG